jgi:hypothetical protein
VRGALHHFIGQGKEKAILLRREEHVIMESLALVIAEQKLGNDLK